MKADLILSKLEKARQTGPDSWVACCPAHEDRHPSMTLRALADGRILMHCFGGCEVEEILGSLGLKFADLYPEPLPLVHKSLRRPFPAADVLECVAEESLFIAVCASIMSRGEQLPQGTKDHLFQANDRIREARRLANGER